MIGWCVLIVANTVFRTFAPLKYRDNFSGMVRIVASAALPIAAVATTGGWNSPFVFSLLTAVIVAGFGRGFTLAFVVASLSAVTVGVADAFRDDRNWRISGQWVVELLLVAAVAAYARRISGEAYRQHTLALDRVGRLADANRLLFSLHRLAQTLPASLDLDEVLDQTVARLRDLFDFEVAAVLILDETDRQWIVARREGTRLPGTLAYSELPPPLQLAVSTKGCVEEPNLLVDGGPGLAPSMYSGLYAVLPARGSIIGLLSLEHASPAHFTSRDVELMRGFAEQAALAIDNARWFTRLRTVGADEERTRIARDLHDRIGQSLAYLAFELDRIVKNDSQGNRVGIELEQLRSDVRGVIREVRDTLYDLRTDVTDSLDLLSVLDVFLQRVRERSGLEITLRSDSSGRLPILQEREVFRIAQEAVTNVERHARARHLTVTWQCDGENAYLEVADDGQGFPVGKAGRLDSYGLIGMRERAASIHAELEVLSTPGAGTRVRCRVGAAAAPRWRRVTAQPPPVIERTLS